MKAIIRPILWLILLLVCIILASVATIFNIIYHLIKCVFILFWNFELSKNDILVRFYNYYLLNNLKLKNKCHS